MRILGGIALGVALLLFGVIAWNEFMYSVTYRYRMTVEIDVGGKLRAGSSVIQIKVQKQPQWISGVTPEFREAKGEAVFVDLGNGRNVIALLARGDAGEDIDYPIHIVPDLFEPEGRDRGLPKYPTHGRRELSRQLLPTLVTFADINDPKSARLVYPAEFEQTFDPSVRLSAAWIEMTEDPVTALLETHLPWWGKPGRPALQAYDAWLQGRSTGVTIEPESLFKRG